MEVKTGNLLYVTDDAIPNDSSESSDYGEYLNTYDDQIPDYVKNFDNGCIDEENANNANYVDITDSDFALNDFESREDCIQKIETLKQNVIILGSKPNKDISTIFKTKLDLSGRPTKKKKKKTKLYFKYCQDTETDDDESIENIRLPCSKKKVKKAKKIVDKDTRSIKHSTAYSLDQTQCETKQNTSRSPKHATTYSFEKAQCESKEIKIDTKLVQVNVKQANDQQTTICLHCKKQFENKDKLIEHLTQVATEELESLKKQELINDLKKDCELLLEQIIDKTVLNDRVEGNVNKNIEIHAAEPCTVSPSLVGANKTSNITEVRKNTKIKKQACRKSKTLSKKTNKRDETTTGNTIKMKIKLKNKNTKEYEVEQTKYNIAAKKIDNPKRDLLLLKKSELYKNLLSNDNTTTITHSPRSPVPNNDVIVANNNFEQNILQNDADMPLLSEIIPNYFYKREQLQLCKVKPVLVKSPHFFEDTRAANNLGNVTTSNSSKHIDILNNKHETNTNSEDTTSQISKIIQMVNNIPEVKNVPKQQGFNTTLITKTNKVEHLFNNTKDRNTKHMSHQNELAHEVACMKSNLSKYDVPGVDNSGINTKQVYEKQCCKCLHCTKNNTVQKSSKHNLKNIRIRKHLFDADKYIPYGRNNQNYYNRDFYHQPFTQRQACGIPLNLTKPKENENQEVKSMNSQTTFKPDSNFDVVNDSKNQEPAYEQIISAKSLQERKRRIEDNSKQYYEMFKYTDGYEKSSERMKFNELFNFYSPNNKIHKK